MSAIATRDPDLQRTVQGELEWNPQIEATCAAMEAHCGGITLSVHIARFAGSEVRSDHEIARAVHDALIASGCVADGCIRWTVVGGQVTLEGEVEHWWEREDAGAFAGRLHGVRGVANHIGVRPVALDSAAISSSIAEALLSRAEIAPLV